MRITMARDFFVNRLYIDWSIFCMLSPMSKNGCGAEESILIPSAPDAAEMRWEISDELRYDYRYL